MNLQYPAGQNIKCFSAVTRISNLVEGNSVPFQFGIGKKDF